MNPPGPLDLRWLDEVRATPLDRRAWGLAQVLWPHLSATGVATVSHETLQRDSGMSPKTLTKGTELLVDAGLLEVDALRKKFHSDEWEPRTYRVRVGRIDSLERDSSRSN